MSLGTRPFVTALTVLTMTSSAFAQQRTPPVECDGSNAEQQLCLTNRLKEVATEIDNVFRNLLIALQQTSKNSSNPSLRRDANEIERRLIQSQRAWGDFRDSDCSLESIGGNIEGIAYDKCLLSKSNARLKQLKSYEF